MAMQHQVERISLYYNAVVSSRIWWRDILESTAVHGEKVWQLSQINSKFRINFHYALVVHGLWV
jgi:hypothetical protein